MLYLKFFFLFTYFIIVFVFFRCSSCLQDGKLTTYGYDLFSTLASVFKSFFGINNDEEAVSLQNTNFGTLNLQENIASFEDEDISSKISEEFEFSETNLISYQDFIEKVEDTKASVWVVRVFPPILDNTNTEPNELKQWLKYSNMLRNYGIKTGTYQCSRDIRLCLAHKITTPAILLSMPKGSQPKGNVAFHLFDPSTSNVSLLMWIQKKLYLKVKTVHSISELKERPARRHHKRSDIHPSLFFVYKSHNNKPPLLLSSLSVRFTGRIKFYMLKINENDKEDSNRLFAFNKVSKYNYGKHKGENFTYSCMELFLKTLHPEVNDIFIASLILLNMACWFEVSFQKGGPLRRILFYMWGFTTSNVLLVTIWLPLLKLIYLPQLQPLMEVFLQSLQKMMFTNFAAVIRQDFLEVSKHVYFAVFGFICYGIFLGYLHFKFRNGTDWATDSSLSEIFQHDIDDIQNLFHSILSNITPTFTIYRFEARIERILNTLSTSQLWLPIDHQTAFIKDLPTWKHCINSNYSPVEELNENQSFSPPENTKIELLSESLKTPTEYCVKTPTEYCVKKCQEPSIPDYIFKVLKCAICLDDYRCKSVIMGLPCGHSFHQTCACDWLTLEEAQNRCPVCRWPCNIKKDNKMEIVDTIE